MVKELIEISPKALLENSNNPRRTSISESAIISLAKNIKEAGLIHPPVVRRNANGEFVIIAGHMRVRACIKAKLNKINVIVEDGDGTLDDLRAGSENYFRTAMSRPDEWKWVEKLRREQAYTDAKLCAALGCSPAYLKQLGALANIYEPILHAIELARGPDIKAEKLIASASLEFQKSLWEKYRYKAKESEFLDPKDPSDAINWCGFVSDLQGKTYYARNAKFNVEDPRFGITWSIDLFDEGKQDNRYTEDRELFAKAQVHWLENDRPEGSLNLGLQSRYESVPPKGYERIYGRTENKEEHEIEAYHLDPRTLEICKIIVAKKLKASGTKSISSTIEFDRSEINVSSRGEKIIGEHQTNAIRAALDDRADEISPWELLVSVLAVLNYDCNVVKRYATYDCKFTAKLFPAGVFDHDEAKIRWMVIDLLKSSTNCAPGGSGLLAKVLGASISADRYLPSFASEKFLSSISKHDLVKLMAQEGLPLRSTNKEMRQNLINHFKDRVWIPDIALFQKCVADKSLATTEENKIDATLHQGLQEAS